MNRRRGPPASGVFAQLVLALVFKTSGGCEQRPQWVRFPYTPASQRPLPNPPIGSPGLCQNGLGLLRFPPSGPWPLPQYNPCPPAGVRTRYFGLAAVCTGYTFSTSSPKWLMTFTAILPDFGGSNGWLVAR